VATAIANKDFDKALSLRDPEFEEGLLAFNALTRLDDTFKLPPKEVSTRSCPRAKSH
jgi:6-phosphofructokinase 1